MRPNHINILRRNFILNIFNDGRRNQGNIDGTIPFVFLLFFFLFEDGCA
mgnify:CR=1 FL=1